MSIPSPAAPAVPSPAVRTCRYPGCTRMVDTPDTPNSHRPVEYCDDPGHSPRSAWRAKQAAQGRGATTADDTGRPVRAATIHAGALLTDATKLFDRIVELGTGLKNDLAVMGDSEAAAAEIEMADTDATSRMAAADVDRVAAERSARTAEQARDAAVVAKEEAETAAADALATGEAQAAEAAAAGLKVAGLEQDLVAAANKRTTLESTVDELQRTEAAHLTRLEDAARDLEGLRQQVVKLTDDSVRADQQRRDAVTRAVEQEQRAKTAETALSKQERENTRLDTLLEQAKQRAVDAGERAKQRESELAEHVTAADTHAKAVEARAAELDQARNIALTTVARLEAQLAAATDRVKDLQKDLERVREEAQRRTASDVSPTT